jgi:putative transposase
MDNMSRWVNNVFVERLWRSVRYEEVYLKAYERFGDAHESLGRFSFYNSKRRHQLLDRQTRFSVYYQDTAREAV